MIQNCGLYDVAESRFSVPTTRYNACQRQFFGHWLLKRKEHVLPGDGRSSES